MKDMDLVFAELAKSPFRRRFRLGAQERAYLEQKGLRTVLEHARDFIDRRLAPANPANDGKQTPFRGHPVFVAQNATATCCRSCLAKWHGIPRGHSLDEGEERMSSRCWEGMATLVIYGTAIARSGEIGFPLWTTTRISGENTPQGLDRAVNSCRG